MALFFLTYDLKRQQDYQNLYEELEKFKAVRILESTWCLERINTSSSALKDYFRKYIDSDDGLIVSAVAYWSAYNTDGTPQDL